MSGGLILIPICSGKGMVILNPATVPGFFLGNNPSFGEQKKRGYLAVTP
jgi:hypothetical protein